MPVPKRQLTTKSSSGKKYSHSEKKLTYKVFVSYSHKNSAEANQFINAFRAAFLEAPDLEIAPEQVFFDRERLLAGDQWSELIHHAMDEAKYFVILLSPESMASEYCLNRELGTALAKGLPIIQVLLSQCAGWADLILPTDLKMRKLGSFGALPKDDNFNYLPVAEWPDASRTEVWKRVAFQILDRVRRDEADHQSQPSDLQDFSGNTQQRRFPPVQYFCDQKVPVSQFDGGVQKWKDKAFLVLTRGLYQDELPRFWDRLQHKNLKDYVKARYEKLLPARPFMWPEMMDQQSDSEALRTQMLRAMSEALTGDMYEIGNPSALASRLSALSGVQPLVTTLPDISINAIGSGLRELMDLLEQCPVNVPVHRLVLAVILEDLDFVQEAALEAKLNLVGSLRTHTVVLDPLQVIEHKDVRLWHRNYEVEQLYKIDEDKLLQGVFGEEHAKPLRLREFAKKVDPLIKTVERMR